MRKSYKLNKSIHIYKNYRKSHKFLGNIGNTINIYEKYKITMKLLGLLINIIKILQLLKNYKGISHILYKNTKIPTDIHTITRYYKVITTLIHKL